MQALSLYELYEIDGGPSGISWEVHRNGEFFTSLPSAEEMKKFAAAAILDDHTVRMHTADEFYALEAS